MSSDNILSESQYNALTKVIDDPKSLVFSRPVVPVALNNKPKKKGPLFEYAEHGFLGDAITLTLADGTKAAASSYNFTLLNGLSLTYGQINGLAGDFYAVGTPISDGKSVGEQQSIFFAAYNTLATTIMGDRMPQEAMDILAVLQVEVNAVNEALAKGENPSIAYAKLPDVTGKLEELTIGRPLAFPGYLGLARINFDHFGVDARTAYNAGHALALDTAMKGDLYKAYTMNAFADHFLEDSFSAGHMRTPRRLLHSAINPAADYCAKLMHDEDNYLGLSVTNPAGTTWMAYGDKRALDDVDVQNKNYCIAAVQASADEVYRAYVSKTAPTPDQYQAWKIAPTLASARAHQILCPLFTFENLRRAEITQRKLWTFTGWWAFATTVAECEASGLWPVMGY